MSVKPVNRVNRRRKRNDSKGFKGNTREHGAATFVSRVNQQAKKRNKMIKEPFETYIDEDKMQAAFYQWTTQMYPQCYQSFFHINNKSKNAIEGNQMKAKGVVKGVADMCLVCSCGRAVWIEFKTATGTQSNEQKNFERLCKKLGHLYFIVRTFTDFKRIYLTYAPINAPI